MIHQGKN